MNGFTVSSSLCSGPSLHLLSFRTCQFFSFIFFHIFHRITLEIMTLQPKCEDVETAEGVAITVTGVAQVKHHTCLGMPVQTPQTPPHPPPPSSPSFLHYHSTITAEVLFHTEGSSPYPHPYLYGRHDGYKDV